MHPLGHEAETLQERLNERVRFDEPLSRHTSLRVGGPADGPARWRRSAVTAALPAVR